MKHAFAVIGANYGDEGKGLITDYLCATEDVGVVVRYNGGAQAGHTVVAPGGISHVFSHFGSGTLLGIPTFLSQFFVCNPVAFFREFETLYKQGFRPQVFAHPECLVTTFVDIILNQRIEDQRGAKRHGSCGMGFNETMSRSDLPKLKITMADLWNGRNLEPLVEELCGKYAMWRTGKAIDEPKMAEAFLLYCKKFAEVVAPAGIGQCKNPVFEGAQGLLLDQGNKAAFPHVTRSNTGLKNVRTLCAQAGIDKLDAYYVTRSYLTRHGAGPLPGEDASMSFEDNTNQTNPWQGSLRFAPLDIHVMLKRTATDYFDGKRDGDAYHIALTHLDQVKQDSLTPMLSAFGPTRADVERNPQAKAA